MSKQLKCALRLRCTVSDATGTQHLKRMKENRSASQRRQCQGLAGIEPARHCDLRRSTHSSIPCVCPWQQVGNIKTDLSTTAGRAFSADAGCAAEAGCWTSNACAPTPPCP